MENSKLPHLDRSFIREYVSQAETDEEKRQRREECAKEFDVSIYVIRAITAWSKIYQMRAAKVAEEKSDTILENDIHTDVIALSEESAQSEESIDIDYDNEIKNRWRLKWKEFIAKHMSFEDRKNAKVLCLPGKQCLEIPLYLDLGFSPQNIVGVEGGDVKTREEFSYNAQRLGIQTRLGKLEDLIGSDPIAYDVVSLDFLGQMSGKYIKIARQILTNRRALMLTNFMAKRERKDIQSCLSAVRAYMTIDEELFKKHGVGTLREIEKSADKDLETGDTSLMDCRTALGLNYFGNVGMYRLENRLFQKKMDAITMHCIPDETNAGEQSSYDQQFEKQRFTIEMGIEAVLRAMEDLLSDHAYSRGEARNTTFIAKALALRALYGTPSMLELESYRYVSQSGAKTSPFESDFAVLEKPKNIHESTRRTTGFLYDACASAIESVSKNQQSPYMVLRDKRNTNVRSGIKLSRSDSFSWEHNTKGCVTGLNAGKFIADLKEYLVYVHDGIPDRIRRGDLELKRENI